MAFFLCESWFVSILSGVLHLLKIRQCRLRLHLAGTWNHWVLLAAVSSGAGLKTVCSDESLEVISSLNTGLLGARLDLRYISVVVEPVFGSQV